MSNNHNTFDSAEIKKWFPPWNRRVHNILMGIFIAIGVPMSLGGAFYLSTYMPLLPYVWYLMFFLILIAFIVSNGGIKDNAWIGVRNIINSPTWPAEDYPNYYDYMKEAQLGYNEQMLFLTICGTKENYQETHGKTWVPEYDLPPMHLLTKTSGLNEKELLNALNGLKQRGLIPKSTNIANYTQEKKEFYEM